MAVENTGVFAGITNENEFYGHHYLADVFKGDIRERLDAWRARAEAAKEHGEEWRSPPHELASCATRWFRQREKLANVQMQDADAWHAAFAELQRPLLVALGYTIAPELLTLVDRHPVRIWQRFGPAGQEISLGFVFDSVSGATPNGAVPSDLPQTFVTPIKAQGSTATVTSASGVSTIIHLPPSPGDLAAAAGARRCVEEGAAGGTPLWSATPSTSRATSAARVSSFA